MKKIVVSDIMTQNPLVINPNTTLLECARKMVKHRVSSFPIAEGKKLVGFIAQYDIIWAISKKSKKTLKEVKAIEISKKKIISIRPNASVKEAIQKMKKFTLRRLPVTKEGELIGIITLRDILNFKPELYPEIEEMERIREETEKLERIKKKQKLIEGMCEECGRRALLQKFNGTLVCESCMNS
jgi:CBS domain-containing protein